MSQFVNDETDPDQYALKPSFSKEDIADACRLLGLSGPLEALLRGWRSENEEHGRAGRQDRGQKSGQESWGKDSGARDLSPDSHKIGTMGAAADCESSSMLSLARKLQNAALSALKIEVEELSSRLRFAERERDAIERRLNDSLQEKEEAQNRLQVVGSAHESRITELHCVIAELSKKLKARQESAIAEEVEPEGSVSELSFQEGSVYNSEMEAINYDRESRAESVDCKQNIEYGEHDRLKEMPALNQHVVNNNSGQIQALQEEIIHLRVQLALLQSQLASENEIKINKEEYPDDVDKNSVTHEDLDAESDAVSYGNDNADDERDIDDTDFQRHSMAKNVKTSSVDLPPTKEVSANIKSHGNIGTNNSKEFSTETPIAKMAERVRLRRTVEEPHLTGTDIIKSGIYTTEIAEHLVSDLLQQDTSSEIRDPYRLYNEIQRLQRRIENMRFQNSVLTLTLAESKSHCEKLYLLCGKYESNAIALHQALNYCDRTIEGYDVLLALLESRVAILEGDDAALDNQKITETVGKNLLLRLQSESSIPVNSVGPWQNTDGICSNNSLDGTPWSEDDYNSLRNLVSKYKALRQLVQNTSVQLESPFFDNTKDADIMKATKAKKKSQQQDNRRMDLETAVLMQELMSMREEVSELKFRLDQTERTKVNAEQRAGALQDALVYLQAQLDDTEALLAKANKNRKSYSDSEHAAGIERELVEALARESRLKARLQCLTSALETAAKTSEEKYAQVQNTVAELKQANLTLHQSFERCKRKYQSRLKSLEQKLLGFKMNTTTTTQLSSQNEELPHDAPQLQGRERRAGGGVSRSDRDRSADESGIVSGGGSCSGGGGGARVPETTL